MMSASQSNASPAPVQHGLDQIHPIGEGGGAGVVPAQPTVHSISSLEPRHSRVDAVPLGRRTRSPIHVVAVSAELSDNHYHDYYYDALARFEDESSETLGRSGTVLSAQLFSETKGRSKGVRRKAPTPGPTCEAVRLNLKLLRSLRLFLI